VYDFLVYDYLLSMDNVFADMLDVLEIPEDEMIELLGEFCTISIERLDEVEEFLALRNQISEGQFTIMLRRLHSLRGGVAMLGIETLNELTGDLQRSLKLTKRTFGISGIPEVSWIDFGTSLAQIKAEVCRWDDFVSPEA